MEGRLAVPFHFAAEFLVLVVALGGALDALRARRRGEGTWAHGQAVGFLALAAAQIAHGSLIAQADSEPLVLGLRTAAFALLALSARPAATTSAVGAAPALILPGMNTTLALAPAAAAFFAAARGVRAHRKDQDPATFAFAAAFVAFGAGEVALALSSQEGGAMIGVSHAARALGAIFLARWLWTSIVRSVRLRFVASFVLVLTIGVLVVSAALNVVIGNTLADEEMKRLADAGAARVTSVRSLGATALSSAQLFAEESAVVAAGFTSPTTAPGRPTRCDPKRALDDFARRSLRILPPDADFIALVARGGKVVGSAMVQGSTVCALPPDQEIQIAGTAVVGEALADRENGSPVLLRYNEGGRVRQQLVALGAYPNTVGRPARVAGVVVVGYRIDRDFLRAVAVDTDADDVAVIAGGEIAASSQDNQALARALRSLEGPLRAAREDKRIERRTLTVGGETATAAFVPLARTDGDVIGQMALVRRASALDEAQRNTTRVLFFITMLAVLIAALLAWVSGGRVTRPIRALTGAVRELRGGNLEARAKVQSADEVGTLGAAFNEMAAELQRTTGGLHAAAQAEAGLRARMEAIVQSMGDGLIATDAAGKVVTFNRAAEQMTGKKAERVVGKQIAEVLRGRSGDRPIAEVAMRAAAAEGVLQLERGAAPVVLTATPLVDARGSAIGRVLVVRDVSREVQAERMKSEFLANVSHELRTPLTGIKGFAEIMNRKKFPRHKVEQFLLSILESTERLERIVEILVDFAAMEAGRLTPRSEPLVVRTVIDDVAKRWRDRTTKHEFVRKAPADLPPVLADARMLDRSLDELVDNAVKFSPEGGKIEIIAEPYVNGARTRKPSKLRITVRDHGIGIEAGRVPELFAEFRQLDGSETRSFGGLGLGLAYVQRIVEAHGGTVEVASRVGRGSTFSLVLPVADTKGVKAQAARPRARTPGRKAKR